jgi:uncharacterized protein YlxP (DUF503 family)
MVVGVMEMNLALYDNDSLKAKRSVVKRVLHRLRNTFNVGAAEIDELDATDRAVLGVVCIGNDRRYLEGQLAKAEQFVVNLQLADVLDAPKHFEVY